uniref:UBC core domain-containing protein n=1 Tax=Leersia perrieri TaxID=77586 RepID=A0A0D9XIC5_9ORYZ
MSTSISFPNGKDDLMNFEIIARRGRTARRRRQKGPARHGAPAAASGQRAARGHNGVGGPRRGAARPAELGGTFVFTFQVSLILILMNGQVYHPNIDLEGNIGSLLNINTVIYGLNLLFTQPNDEDPLNHEAAAVLREDRDNPKLFEVDVRRAMAGGYVGQHYFPCA